MLFAAAYPQWMTLQGHSSWAHVHAHTHRHTQLNKGKLEGSRRRGELWPRWTFKSWGDGWNAVVQAIVSACASLPYCLFVRVGQGWDNWSLAFAFLPSGLNLVSACMQVCACACLDHLVGTVANFSIRHTHTIFSIHPKGQALFIHYCVLSQWVAVPLQADAGGLQ